MIAITGCARSGTAYTAAVLQHLGYDVRHEEMGEDGTVSWPLAAKTRRAPWGPSPEKTLAKAKAVFHQVRAPLGAIRSIHTIAERSWAYVYETTPCRPTDSPLLRSAMYWRHWNLMSEKVAQSTFRLEAMKDALPAICWAMKRPPRTFDVDSVPRANARAGVVPEITWDDLRRESATLCDEIREQARRYGYAET
jgi:hypothetical protein